MKTKKYAKKLALNKKTIANINTMQLGIVKGGGLPPAPTNSPTNCEHLPCPLSDGGTCLVTCETCITCNTCTCYTFCFPDTCACLTVSPTDPS
jgi:hypothetical protein